MSRHSTISTTGTPYSNIRTTISRHRSRLSITALAAGWALLTADAIPVIPLTIPDPTRDLIGWAVVTGTVVVGIAATVRGAALHSAVRLGRLIEQQIPAAGRPRTRRIEDEVTHGIGISVN